VLPLNKSSQQKNEEGQKPALKMSCRSFSLERLTLPLPYPQAARTTCGITSFAGHFPATRTSFVRYQGSGRCLQADLAVSLS